MAFPLIPLLMMAGSTMSAVGKKQEADSAAGLQDFNSRQLRIDAMIAMENASEEAKRLRLSGRQLTGQQRTRFAKSGVRLEGTPLEVMAASIENIEMDAIKTRQEGLWKGKQLGIQSKFQSSQASGTRKAGSIGLASGIIGGAAQSYSMFAGN